ncbi:MAG: hypothetical protein O2931_14300, partial [Planctomycetota bacterium]|nr:hypothetical protein [Planctomycetota bacterium]
MRREDQFEAYQPSDGNRSAFPGQLVQHWPGDIDSDGVPNVSDFSAPSGQIPSPSFTPVRLFLPTPIDLSRATVRFHYPAFPANSNNHQQGVGGSIRLWTRDGTQNRLPWSIDQGGDLVLPDTTYRVSEVGNSQTLTLFVEGVSPSLEWADVLLEVSLDPDGPTGRFASFLLIDDDPPASAEGRATHLARDAVRLTIESVQTVQILANDLFATESQLPIGQGEDFAAFTVSRGEQQVQGDLSVAFRLDNFRPSAATPLTDFVLSASSSFFFDPVTQTGTVTIPGGRSSALIYVHPVDNSVSEWDESVTLELLPPALSGSMLSPKNYEVGIGRAVVSILDDDGATSVLHQNADVVSTSQAVETIRGDTLEVNLHDGRVRLLETPGTTAFQPNFVGSEGARPILLLDLDLPTTGTGDRVKFSVRFATMGVQSFEYPLASRQEGPVRVAFPIDATSLPTGSYDYDVEVHLLSANSVARTKTVRGRWSIQNLSNRNEGDSHFGTGWWVTALDRVAWDDGLPELPSRLANEDSTYRLARQGARVEQGVALLRGDQTAAWYNLPAADLQIAHVVNDRSSAAGYVESHAANWIDGTNIGGYLGNYRVTRDGAAAEATWNLSLTDDAVVQLLTTWVPDLDRDPNATYTVQGVRRIDDPAGPLAWSVQVDQRVTPGARFIDGQPWYSLGFVQAVPGMSLRVVASGSGQGRLVADAIAIARPMAADAFETPNGTFGQLLYRDDELVNQDKWGRATTFDAQRRLVTSTDRNGNPTRFTYEDADNDGRSDELSSVREPFGGDTHFFYSNGRLDGVVDFANRHTLYSGDTTREVRLPDPGFGQQGSVTWTIVTDIEGRLTTVVDPRGTATEVVYAGQSSRASQVIEASTEAEQAQWTIVSLVERATAHNALPKSLNAVEQARHQDARSNVWTFEVDSFGYATKRTNPFPFQATWSWNRDANGLVEQWTEPAGAGGSLPLPELTTAFQYDALGNLVREVYADGTALERRFDRQFSQLLYERDAIGREVRYELDGRGNIVLREKRNRSGPHRLTRYVVSPPFMAPGDLPGGLLQETTVAADSQDAVTTKVVYYVGGSRNGLPQMQTEAFGTARARTTEWDYDAARYVNRQTLQSAEDGDRTTLFVTDPLGRQVTRVEQDPGTSDHGPAVSSWKYDELGNVVLGVDARNSRTFWQYDARGRLELKIWVSPGGAVDANQASLILSYVYDANGNLVGTSDGRGITHHDYDERNFKSRVTYQPPNVPDSLLGTST